MSEMCIQELMELALILLVMLAGAASSKPALKFRSDGKFKVVLFADLHFGEAPETLWGPEQDVKSTRVMSKILDSEEPDLVVYLGDLVTANNVPAHNASKYWSQALAPSIQRKVPFATIFGNHDDAPYEGADKLVEPGTTRKELMESEAREALSVSSQGPHSLLPSVSNYHLKVSSSKKPGSSSALLYFLDSGGGTYPQAVSSSQASWLRNLTSEINPEKKTLELLFWHIPSKAYEKVASKPKDPIPKQCSGSINLEGVASQAGEWGVMELLASRSSMKAVFSGHNHGLDWCCPNNKLWLCFARHTGYGGYGNWSRGARVLEISEADSFVKSWIRLENGSVMSEVQLH